jgi:segregation and condensation protein A
VVRVSVEHIHAVKASVADAIVELADELPRIGRITFRRLTGELVDTIEIVVRFLAVLELFKQGLVDLDQPSSFGEIEIRWIGDTDDVDGRDQHRVDLTKVDVYDG